MWRSGVLGLGSATLSIKDRNMAVTTTPIRGIWFERFTKENNRKTFDLSGETLHEFLGELGEGWGWGGGGVESHRRDIEDLVVFIIMGYFGILIGEEVQLYYLKGI